ncbi:YihY/virulence factor BrkB family protein [Mucilaginibacter phenanthrenivorans]|uniref:YihY/virulence factor BrkB family protein n=1 Tax=Mucilaginibacter phenanthrenivorans TaxID=1234842 RepID=UPI0021582A20|nr:YihY/virulence factor BrkB family protein [Mucilaginibacter phenanthrenivorans]
MAFNSSMKVFSKAYFKEIWKILVATFMGFINDNGLKLSASLAYYTIFSIAPLLILIISIAGLVWGADATSDKLYPQIQHYVGQTAALQIQDILKKLQLSGKSGTAVVIGVVTLLIGASSIFIEIQDSLNIIWRVKAKPKKGWVKLIQNRFISFSLIISLGFLMLVSLVLSVIMTALSSWIGHFLHAITTLLIKGINLGITFIIISILFGIIFKFLPDVKIKWRDVRTGAFFTAILFMLGQYAINVYIQYTAKSSAYGAAGSILVILVWIYYTAAILYIGAEFTQVYAEAIGSHIEPAEYAVSVQQTEVIRDVKVLPAQNPELKGSLKPEAKESS